MPNVSAMGAGGATQLSFADLGPRWDPAAFRVSPVEELPLRETTFVVVDLETTGGRTKSADGAPCDAITEIGAVKVRGGVVLGEFATLVDPQRSIPPQIVQLTGITTAMVCDAPTIDAVLPMFFDSLYSIIASRVVVGTAEAAILTVGNALMGDYFDGEHRRQWLGVQMSVGPIMAMGGTPGLALGANNLS